jgi:hypothetical protein
MLCLLFSKRKWVVHNIKTPKTQKKRVSTLKYNNLSLLKEFMIFFTDGSCGLPLEVGHLDDLWFATQLWSNYSKLKIASSLQVIFV